MPANTFGEHLRLTTFGESHGVAIGGVLEGVPAGIDLDLDAIQHMLDRRRPGQSAVSTPRKESDRLEILSGVFESRTTGTPIGLLIRNEHQHSADYNAMKDLFRPSHADYTYYKKYGVRDHRGGGRSSARETAVRVAGGAIARQVLPPSVRIVAYVSAVGGIALWDDYTHYDLSRVDDNIVRCPDAAKAAEMATSMCGMDTLVFTAGIGEHAPAVRAGVADRLAFMGVKMDHARNALRGDGAWCLSAKDSKVKIFVIPTDEEIVIARDTLCIVTGKPIE